MTDREIIERAIAVACRDQNCTPEILTTLDLSRAPVSDVSALAGLTNLRTLWLRGTQVSDVSALAGLVNLEELFLRDTPVSDVSALAGLTKLEIYR